MASDRDPSIWEFLHSIITLGLGLLKPESGKYMTHCNGLNATTSISAYEQMLTDIGKCSFERSQRFVHSFHETWLFYRITRHL